MKISAQITFLIIFTVSMLFQSPCFSETERESIMNHTHSLSWAYYTGDENRWYISTTLNESTYFNNIYSLMPIKNNAGWGTVAENAIVLDTVNNSIMVDDHLDSDTSNYYYDIGWREWVEDDLIVQDRTRIQGKNGIIKWYFFYVAGTGRWYIINTPEYFNGISVLKFASKDGQYDWIETDTNDLQPVFFMESNIPKIKFEQSGNNIPITWNSISYPVFPYTSGSYNGRSFYYNNVHLGEDIDLAEGAEIRAIADGYIKKYGSAIGYGNLVVVIEHELNSSNYVSNNFHFYEGEIKTKTLTDSKYCSIYGHLRKDTLSWSVGDFVKKGDIIGYIENEAYNGDGDEHLHMGIFGGKWIGYYFGYENTAKYTYSNVKYYVSAKELIEKLMSGIDVVDFWLISDPIYHSTQKNFDAQFKLKNITSSPITVQSRALAIHNSDGSHLFDLAVDNSPITLESGQSTSGFWGEGAIWNAGNYEVVAKVYLNGQWIELASQDIVVH